MDKHYQPFNSEEFRERDLWNDLSKSKKLKPFDSISVWMDICGFGNELEKYNWDLSQILESGLIKILNQTYNIASEVNILGINPLVAEKILVLNDGIAKTVDINSKLEVISTLFFIRNQFLTHYLIINNLIKENLGLRTVIAGGQRIQYTSKQITGKSILYYTNKASSWGQKILDEVFVYNPIQFQMNTAFANAYSIDALGTKNNILPNRVYIDDSALTTFSKIAKLKIVKCNDQKGNIIFQYKNETFLEIEYDALIKNKRYLIYRVKLFKVCKPLEGEETLFVLDKWDNFDTI